jgi:two-component system CheB/CheR fusion protein
MMSRIFEPFQQGEASTSRRYGGLGLGLSVAKGLVDAHGGTITGRSEGRDRGATFTIDLPTVASPAVTKVPAARAGRVQRALRILLVEDHADTRKALERLLRRWGHEVTCAATVAEGLEMAFATRPELILSDVGLPDGTGVDLLIQLRAAGVELLAVAMSGYGMEGDREQTREAGFVEHLVKPVAAERLREVIERLTASRD